jgi:hypothetical protein
MGEEGETPKLLILLVTSIKELTKIGTDRLLPCIVRLPAKLH